MNYPEDNGYEDLLKICILGAILYIAFILTSGCAAVKPSTPAPPPAVAPPSAVAEPAPAQAQPVLSMPVEIIPIDLAWIGPHSDWNAKHPEWTLLLLDALDKYGQQLMKALPNIVETPSMCQSGKAYLVALISRMSFYESNHSATALYQEKFKDRFGEYVVSRGPLQVSEESCNGYGAKIEDQRQLHDPAQNFKCAVLILNKWVPKDMTIAGGVSGDWRGGARYWSVLRDPVKKKDILQFAGKACK